MFSVTDEFQVVLHSNVGGNQSNTPYLYETALSILLDLPEEWDVALIDIVLPHNWIHLDKTYPHLFMRFLSHQETEAGYLVLRFKPDYKTN